MREEINRQIVQEFFEAFAIGDVTSMEKLVDPTCSFWTAGDAWFSGRYERDFLLALVGQGPTAFPDGINLQVLSTTCEGNRVAAEVVSDGVNHAGERYNNHYHFLFEFKNGKMTMYKEYMDTAHAYEILGREKPRKPAKR